MTVFIHKMVIDTCPFADSFGSGDIVSFSHYSYKVCELEIGACPFDSGIGVLACEKREEVIRVGIRCNPLSTEEILIECRDTTWCS